MYISSWDPGIEFDLWLSHAPSTYSDKQSVTGAMVAVTVGDISQEAIDDFI